LKKKYKRENEPKQEIEPLNLDEIETLIIDGNNLFYVDPEVRNFLLQNRSKK
jgi:hypothetical protein